MRLLRPLIIANSEQFFLRQKIFEISLKSQSSRDKLKKMVKDFLCQRLTIPGVTSVIEGPTELGAKFPNLGAVVNEALKYLFPLAGILLFINLILGGFQYLVSGGDQKAMSAAQGRITNSIIGFVILFVAYFIVQIFGFIFRLPTF